MAESPVSNGPAKDRKRHSPVAGRRSRIGVLPFLPDRLPEDEEFAVSISETIAAALAQCASCDVIAPGSLMDRSAIALGAADANEMTDIDYLVEGAVSSEEGRVHATVRLLDLGECARAVWNERVVVSPGKLHKSGRLIASRILGGIDPVTLFFDGRVRQRRRDGATGLLLSAIQLMSTLERRKYEDAGRLIDRALQIEPENAMAAAWAAFWQVVYVGQGWTQNLTKASAIAQVRASTAVRSNPDDAETLAICGHVSSFLGRDYDTALYYFDRAQRLDASLEFP
jgi:TolB-like protein